MKINFFKLFRYLSILAFASIIFLFITNIYIINSTQHQITSDIKKLSHVHAAIVLGTNPKLGNGLSNPYFTYRMQASYDLYKNHKIDFLIVSGDNSNQLYNEPIAMRDALIAAGIPDSAIFLDYAGLRTFDSMIRLKEIFGVDSAIVVSQEFHNQRAIFIANKLSMYVMGYNAKNILQEADLYTKMRECMAKSKVFLDFWFGIKPKFGGEQIPIQELACRAIAE